MDSHNQQDRQVSHGVTRVCVFNGVRTDNGNYHYRGFEPWKTLRSKDPNYLIKHISNIDTEALEQADVIFFQRLMGANVVEVAAYFKHKGKKIKSRKYGGSA